MVCFICIAFVLNPAKESKRVASRLNAAESLSSPTTRKFWSNRVKGRAMAFLQDRIEQVGPLLERCEGALTFIHSVLFPLNPLPERLHRLLNKFRDGFRIHKFIHREMISGAMSALAWVKAHHRRIILKDVAEGPPPASNGEPLDMTPFYDVALKPA